MSVDLLRDDSIGIWVQHPEHQDERYCVRPLSPDMMRHFELAATRKVVDPKTRQMVDEVGPEHDRRKNELIWDHAISNWELTDKDGKPWPCTLDNKLALAGKYADRVNWIINLSIEFANDDRARERAEQESFRNVGQAPLGPAVAELQRVSESE